MAEEVVGTDKRGNPFIPSKEVMLRSKNGNMSNSR